MPIPLQNEVVIVEPNTVKYDLSIASRISEGRLIISVGVSLRPCRCDTVDGVEVYQDGYTETPQGWSTGDLEAYAVANPDLATGIMQAWTAISTVVAAINSKEKLL
jgi:hypothetical protein